MVGNPQVDWLIENESTGARKIKTKIMLGFPKQLYLSPGACPGASNLLNPGYYCQLQTNGNSCYFVFTIKYVPIDLKNAPV